LLYKGEYVSGRREATTVAPNQPKAKKPKLSSTGTASTATTSGSVTANDCGLEFDLDNGNSIFT
jgi:hypothetical protein